MLSVASTLSVVSGEGGGCITCDVPLRDKTWFGTGGNAAYFAQPCTTQEFKAVIAFAKDKQLASVVIGAGANVLVNDRGYQGLVIRPALKDILIEECGETQVLVTVGAGVHMQELIDYCLAHHIRGLEEFSGIPGTVGGSVYINLHYYEFLLAQFMHSAVVIDRITGEVMSVDTRWFKFGYNSSTLHNGDYYLISATFLLLRCSDLERMYAQGRRDEIIRHRLRRYPHQGTCGSFFRNFTTNEVAVIGKTVIHVAYYLDKLGIKGELSSGGARVSWQHVNMIVAHEGATSTDIIMLARTMQQMVYEYCGLIPQPECVLLGFDQYPLL